MSRELSLPPPPIKPMFDQLPNPMTFEWSQWLLSIRSALPKIQTFEALLDPVSVAATTLAEQNFAITGLSVYDQVSVSPGSALTVVIAYARVSVNNVLTIGFYNPTAAPINLPSDTWRIVAVRM